MASPLKIDLDVEDLEQSSVCHFLPVSIKHDGPAKVSSYFTPIILEKDNKLTASFRGKPLVGKKIKIPDNYSGVILEKSEGGDQNLTVSSTFEELTYWKWDQVPTEDDNIPQAIKSLRIAATIHGPVSSDE